MSQTGVWKQQQQRVVFDGLFSEVNRIENM